MFGPLGLSFAPYVRSSRTLSKWLTPIANWYVDAAGWRKYGFKYDDLLQEESPTVQRALTRLKPGDYYDRSFRFKRACQASVLHAPLPKEEWTKSEDDVRYLVPYIEDVMNEEAERKHWDTMIVERK